jgi:tRNA (adenine22-N1)-methyltransferase
LTRLEKISSYISDNEKVLDVGCDQALLSKILAKRKIYSIASDLRPNIIENAKKNLTPLEKEYITFSVSNGVPTILNEEYTLVLSGMGAHTILDILKNSNYRFNKIITISNNNNDILRTEMSKLNYYVLEEEIIKEKGKFYNLIVFDNVKRDYSKEQILVGINHKNKELLKEKNEYLIKKYTSILNIANNEKLIDIVNTLKDYKY